MTTNERPDSPELDAAVEAALEPLAAKIIEVLDSEALEPIMAMICKARGIELGDDPHSIREDAMDAYYAVEAETQSRLLLIVREELGLS